MLPPLNQTPDALRADARIVGGPTHDALRYAPSAAAAAPVPSSLSARRPTVVGGTTHAAARRVSAMAKPPPTGGGAGAGAAFVSRRRATLFRPPSPAAQLHAPPADAQPLRPGDATAVETQSRIPREFFVVETSAVLPQLQYPPAQYQSTFVSSGAWETVVFPALAPHTRQQVLHLRQTLDGLRARAASSSAASSSSASSDAAAEYAEREWALHSLCFHELARQIKFICREQSELLFEIQAAYDAAVARLVAAVRQLEASRADDRATIDALQQLQAKSERQRRVESESESSTTQGTCSCGRSGRAAGSRGRRGRAKGRRRRDGNDSSDGASDGGSTEDDDDDDDDDDDEDEQAAWREFQRQRVRGITAGARPGGDGASADRGDDDSPSGGRLQRASVVEENTAAARVQQAFLKYQQRQEAHRLAQRQEKKHAALDIQRSYRGYRLRQRALHHRAVMQTILKRRKQVAAVELLQINVRAYLIKRRREDRHGVARDSRDGDTTPLASMLEAQRSAVVHAELLLAQQASRDARRTAEDGETTAAMTAFSATPLVGDAASGADSDRFAQLVSSMHELAAAFSFLHSRRRHAKRQAEKTAVATATTPMAQKTSTSVAPGTASVVSPPLTAELPSASASKVDGSDTETNAAPTEQSAHASVPANERDGRDAHPADDDRALVDAAIRRAEELMHTFRAAICDLRRSEGDGSGADGELTKATSTATLVGVDDRAASDMVPPDNERGDALAAASFLFLDDDDSATTAAASGRASPHRSPRRGLFLQGDAAPSTSANEEEDAMCSDRNANGTNDNDDDDDDGDDTHLDDVLWQTAMYAPRSAEEMEDEASARRLLLRELAASRDLQRRHVATKQLIADIYDTVVGRLSELTAARRQKLLLVHASLALAFADGRRVLRSRRHRVSNAAADTACDYEPVGDFVGRLDLAELLRDHFHCQVGLKHLVDAAVARVLADLRQFMGLDADVQRFHDFLTRERPGDELVFFCLCRLLARDANAASGRQPVFHPETMREVVDVGCAVGVARTLFLAGGDDDALRLTDAFVIEPSNEIYVRHLPSSGLHQVEAILRNYVSPVDLSPVYAAHESPNERAFVRATNANHFHASEYNAASPRSPLVRRQPPASQAQQQQQTSTDAATAPSSQWIFLDELVDLLRRYRSVMCHFHAFISWTYELFQEAYRQQRHEQALGGGAAMSPSTVTPLLEEAAFVQTLLPFSLGAGERELRNVFHNALKQRSLQRLMPIRVFVSVVLVLLRNGLLSVTSYRPLQTKKPDVTVGARHGADVSSAASSSLATHRRQREEKQWLQLALQWRTQEQHFEAAVERLYARAGPECDGGDHDSERAASQLLQWRNELYELFMGRAGRESVVRAQRVYELLVEAMDHAIQQAARAEHAETAVLSRDGEPCSVADAAAAVAGSPWATREPETPSW